MNIINYYNNLDEYDKEEDKVGMKLEKIKNNAAASLQTTSEQLIKESEAHRTDDVQIPNQRINDEDELNDYKLRKRKEFEDKIKRQKYHIGCWMKYCEWEEHQGEFARARSIYQRALEIEYKNTTIWLKYAEMEMKNKNINHARNVWERACKLLPRVDQFWFKYAYMEEMLGNYVGARQIFLSWMTWEPIDNAWLGFAKFEERLGEIENARNVLFRYIEVHPNLLSFTRVAKFEEKHGNIQSCRRLYESALADLGKEALNEDFFVTFIKFEMRMKEFDRCRALFKYGLENIDKEKIQKLYKFYVKFEKMNGAKTDIEDVIYTKRKIVYEKELEKNALNYDVWFDLTRLEENYGTIESTREAYEKAITNIPPIAEKKYWRRYIFLWINYAVYEEYNAKNNDRTREIFKKMIEIIPHKKFTFSKIWILYAHFYIRQKNLDQARKIFGMSIAVCPREKIFKAYIELELQLGNVDKCRAIYEKFIQTNPDNYSAWVKYAELEKSLEEYDRCVAILQTAISQPLDMPEMVWKTYINVEISYKKFNNVRKLYEVLLEKTRHIKVWLSFAKFEQDLLEFENSRDIFERAYNYFKESKMKEERLMILENWVKTEENNLEKFQSGNLVALNINEENEEDDEEKEKNTGSILDQLAVEEKIASFDFELNCQKTIEVLKNLNKRKPDKIKKRRKIANNFTKESSVAYNDMVIEENDDDGWEEYYEYIFPDDEETKKNFKILGHALKWHKDIKETN